METDNSMIETTQKTLSKAVTFIGIGLHTGKRVSMTILPAKENIGINFVRKDVEPKCSVIPAHWDHVVSTHLSTTLANSDGVSVSTVEHVLAALRANGVDNAIIEIGGPEVPIMDGSCMPFVSVFEAVGLTTQATPRKLIYVKKPVKVRLADRFAMLMPSETARVSVRIDFKNKLVGFQTFSVDIEPEKFNQEIAPARTFAFSEQLDQLREDGLIRGGSLRNAIVVKGEQVLNHDGLRFEEEFARHKLLDCYGDLALADAFIVGHLYAFKPGHDLNVMLLRKLFACPQSWEYNENHIGPRQEHRLKPYTSDSRIREE